MLPGDLPEFVEGASVDLPPEPGCVEGAGEDARDDDPEPCVDEFLHVGLLVHVPERVEAPEVQFAADPLDPCRLVDREDRPGDDSFDPELLPGGEESPREIQEFFLLLSRRLHLHEGETRRLGLQCSEADVRGVEHVTFRVPGDDRDQADHLFLLHRLPAGEGGVFPAGEEYAEFHDCSRSSSAGSQIKPCGGGASTRPWSRPAAKYGA